MTVSVRRLLNQIRSNLDAIDCTIDRMEKEEREASEARGEDLIPDGWRLARSTELYGHRLPHRVVLAEVDRVGGKQVRGKGGSFEAAVKDAVRLVEHRRKLRAVARATMAARRVYELMAKPNVDLTQANAAPDPEIDMSVIPDGWESIEHKSNPSLSGAWTCHITLWNREDGTTVVSIGSTYDDALRGAILKARTAIPPGWQIIGDQHTWRGSYEITLRHTETSHRFTSEAKDRNGALVKAVAQALKWKPDIRPALPDGWKVVGHAGADSRPGQDSTVVISIAGHGRQLAGRSSTYAEALQDAIAKIDGEAKPPEPVRTAQPIPDGWTVLGAFDSTFPGSSRYSYALGHRFYGNAVGMGETLNAATQDAVVKAMEREIESTNALGNRV